MKIIIKQDNTYRNLLIIGVIVFILSNTYFGWNKTAQSGSERVCDWIWQTFTTIGLIGMSLRQMVINILCDLRIREKREDV